MKIAKIEASGNRPWPGQLPEGIPVIVWQRFFEPARLGIAYCPWLAGWLSCPTKAVILVQ